MLKWLLDNDNMLNHHHRQTCPKLLTCWSCVHYIHYICQHVRIFQDLKVLCRSTCKFAMVNWFWLFARPSETAMQTAQIHCSITVIINDWWCMIKPDFVRWIHKCTLCVYTDTMQTVHFHFWWFQFLKHIHYCCHVQQEMTGVDWNHILLLALNESFFFYQHNQAVSQPCSDHFTCWTHDIRLYANLQLISIKAA